MNEVLLIRKVNLSDKEKAVKVSFVLEGMDEMDVCNHVIGLLNQKVGVDLKDITIKYNGVSVETTTGKIPEIVAQLINAGLSVYGVYELYDN
jgi:hypothetical protein